MRRSPERWKSTLARFVSSVGAQTLADELNLSDRSVVYKWVRGTRLPDPRLACALRDIAQSNGFQVSLDDVYSKYPPRVRVRLGRRREV